MKTSSVVEVEFVERATRLLFSKPAENPAPTTNAIKPAVAALDRPAKSN